MLCWIVRREEHIIGRNEKGDAKAASPSYIFLGLSQLCRMERLQGRVRRTGV